MKPPRRERRPRIIDGTFAHGSKVCGEKWTLQEKKKLLDGLKCYGLGNLEQIQEEFLPRRKLIDIKHFISNVKQRFKYMKSKRPENKAPVEVWLDEADNLTTKIHDYSFVLANTFSVFGNLEPHDNLQHKHGPNWGEIYLFLSALLRGGHPPELSPINAMIVLTLLDGLANELRQMDTKIQRLLMKRKFAILSQTTKANNKILAYRWAQTALEKDPFERIPQLQANLHQGYPAAVPEPSVSGNLFIPSAVINSSEVPDIERSMVLIDRSGRNKGCIPNSNLGFDTSCQSSNTAQAAGTNLVTEQASSLDTQNNGGGDDNDVTGDQMNTPVSASDTEHASRNQGNKDLDNGQPDFMQAKTSFLYSLNPFCIPVKYLNLSLRRT